MGTNYYVKENNCEACGRHDEIHLGKSSFGWQFSFQYNGGQYYKNVQEMRKWTANKIIKDEYGAVISYSDFWKMVFDKQNSKNKNHAKYVMEQYPESSYKELVLVIDDFSFTDCEFS